MPSPSARRSNIASDVAWSSLEVADVRLRHSEEHTDVGLARPCPSPEDGDHGTHVASGEAERMSSRSQSPGGATGRNAAFGSSQARSAHRADRPGWYTSAGLDPLAVPCIVLGMHSRRPSPTDLRRTSQR